VFSSSSSPQDELSAGFSEGLGDSSKQGRKTDAETKGRKIDFGKDYGLDADAVFDDTVGTTQHISTVAEQVPTARQNVPTAILNVTTANEEAARIRSLKGKAYLIWVELRKSTI
jgi:hypothetical protein